MKTKPHTKNKKFSWVWNAAWILTSLGLVVLLVFHFGIVPYMRSKSDSILNEPTPILLEELKTEKIYSQWVETYVKDQGGKARVITHENGETVSEGIAYGMLLAAHHEDWELFNKFNNYVMDHLTENGFMNWKVDSDGKVTARGEATDAEIDRAHALLIAYDKTKKESYLVAATELITKIEENLIDKEGMFLEPWNGSGPGTINLSYYDPYVFRKFNQITKNHIWLDLIAAYYKVIDDIKLNEGTAQTGLLPDWSTSDGKVSMASYGPRSYDSSYDASRIYWRLMIAALNGDERAQAHLKLVSDYGDSINILNTQEFWSIRSLDGTPNYREKNVIGALPFAAAHLANGTIEDQNWAIKSLHDAWDDNYFNFTMKALLVTSFEKKG